MKWIVFLVIILCVSAVADSNLKQAKAYYFGTSSVEKDYGQAKKYFIKASRDGSTMADRYLANMYLFGVGVPLDRDEAKKWFEKAIAKGDAKAKALHEKYFGTEVMQTEISKRDTQIRTYKKTTQTISQLRSAKLDFIYGKKNYNKKDYFSAKKLYKSACEKGLSDVCNTLAFMYLDGLIEHDYSEMVMVLNHGCANDNAQSCLLLATVHMTMSLVRDDKRDAAVKTKGCKLLESLIPRENVQEKMIKWNCISLKDYINVAKSREVFLDDTTDLMWQDNGDTKSVIKDWQGAKEYCQALTLAGHGDWYLPDRDQLLELSMVREELKNSMDEYYWSTTIYEDYDFSAWGVHLDRQSDDWGEKDSILYVRCVRNEQI